MLTNITLIVHFIPLIISSLGFCFTIAAVKGNLNIILPAGIPVLNSQKTYNNDDTIPRIVNWPESSGMINSTKCNEKV
jgi:hypothetical protein